MDLAAEITELLKSLDEKLRIDSPQFEEQAKKAAQLMSLWGRMFARAKLHLKNTELSFEIWEANTEISVREFLEAKYQHDLQVNTKAEKPTEAKVKANVKRDKEYALKRREVHDASYFVDVCEKAGYESFKQQCYLLNVVNQIMLKQK